MAPILITVEGNIGAGKTTFLDSLRTHLPTVKILLEPVGEWCSAKNAEGKSILQLFYEDKKRWGMTFQLFAFLSRLEDLKRMLREYDTEEATIILTERSVLTDRYVFAEMLHRQGFLDDLEWTLYLKWFQSFAADLPIQGILYLTTSAETSKERIGHRGREGEASISLDYLADLEAQHRHWIRTTDLPVLEVSTEPDTDEGERLSRIQAWLQTFKVTSL